MRILALILMLIGGPVSAATVQQEIDYTFTAGPLVGTTVEVRYSYPTLPPGQQLETYSPPSNATASYLDARADAITDLIFSGGVDILTPEPYIRFSFDPAANSTGLMSFDVWNVSGFGIYFSGDPDIQSFRCGQGVDCVFRTAIVPLPATAFLLALSLLLMGTVGKRSFTRATHT